ncbi:hypothetical protein CR159_21315 [Pollutimonas subterranea]|uniref:Thioredoxin-like fold domain-containing protein n=2 Tax=Pollutimonas subterranea TaxID=2045210 RepID=A0A2N4TYP5_9BURK|nr:hypothetical protein CR159_21315 [Pollutimonas subterranea]
MTFAISGFVYEQSQVRKKGQLANTKTTELERMHAPVYGPADAKVTIVEFFDPSCETCRAFYPAVKELVNTNGGKVKLVIRYGDCQASCRLGKGFMRPVLLSQIAVGMA